MRRSRRHWATWQTPLDLLQRPAFGLSQGAAAHLSGSNSMSFPIRRRILVHRLPHALSGTGDGANCFARPNSLRNVLPIGQFHANDVINATGAGLSGGCDTRG